MKKRVYFYFVLLLLIVGISCNNNAENKKGIKAKIYKIVERSFSEMLKLQKKRIKELKISRSQLNEAKLIIYQINLLIWQDDVQKFIEMLNDIIFYNVLEEDKEICPKDRLIDEVEFVFFKRLFFSDKLLRKEGLKPPYHNNYHNFLEKILYNKNNKLYKMIIKVDVVRKGNVKNNNYEFFCYTCWLGKYKWYTGFGIQKVNTKWKITSLNMK